MYLTLIKVRASQQRLALSLISVLLMSVVCRQSLAAGCQIGQPLQEEIGVIIPSPGTPVGTLLSTSSGSNYSTVLKGCVSEGVPRDIYVETSGDTVVINGRTITNIGDSGIGFAVKIQADTSPATGHAKGMHYLGERRTEKDDSHTTVVNTVNLPAGETFSINAHVAYEFYKTKATIKAGIYHSTRVGSLHLEGDSATSDILATNLRAPANCNVDFNSRSQSITMGDIPLEEFTVIGHETEHHAFQIKMACTGSTRIMGKLSDTHEKGTFPGDFYSFSPTNWSGKGNRGIGIRVDHKGGDKIRNGVEQVLREKSAEEMFTLNLEVYYYQFSDTIIPGPLTGNLIYNFTFE